MWRQSATHSHSLRRESKNAPWEFQTKHLGSLTAANWVSFDFNVAYSSRWDYSLINTLKLKKTQNYYIILFWAITKAIFTSLYLHFLQWVLRALWNRCSEHQCMCRYISSQMFFDIYVHICKHTRCRVCTYVYIHIYICICMHMYMDTYVRLWCCLTRWGVVAEIFYLCIGVHIHAYVYVCACMRVYVHVYMYVYVYMYVCVCVCIYMYIHARVGLHMHSCRRILFICTVQSLYYTCVYHRCFTCMCMWEGIGSGGLSSWFMVSTCCWRGRLCFGRGRDRGFVLHISLFWRVLGWCVGVCLYTRVHTHKLLGYLL